MKNPPNDALAKRKEFITFLVILFITIALGGGGLLLVLGNNPVGLELAAPVFGYWMPHPRFELRWRRFALQTVITVVLILLSLYVYFRGDYQPAIQHGVYSLTLLVVGYWLE